MGVDLIKPSFSIGELSPSLFGRVDLQAFHRAAGTMRNMFVDYKGGASSRAGLAFVGRCKQSGSAAPPRDINFQFSIDQGYALEFGDNYMRVKSNGAYVTEGSQNITDITQANPAVVTVAGHGFSDGDWVYLSDIVGMEELNNQTYIIYNATADTFALKSILEVPVSSLDFDAYDSGGTAARIFTLETPYAAVDLPLLKYAQSADVMTLTHNSYPVYDLTRLAADDWTLSPEVFQTSIDAPTGVSCSASSTTTSNPAAYQYVVTAIDKNTGQESEASAAAGVTNSVNINSVLGSLTLTWDAVEGASQYNVYKAPVSANAQVPVGVIFGYIATTFGLSYVDSNITADFSIAPPLHINPFAINTIDTAEVTAGGSGYTSSPTLTINTSTGTGAVLQAVIVGGALAGVIIVNPGEGYSSSDTVTVSGGGGSGGTVAITIGASTGTYPGVVAYFQQRRAFGNTINAPDTYFLSKPGAFNNFDASPVAIDSDSIVGSPWAQQINGIQWMIPMPGGLVVLTGAGAWLLNGGGQGQPLTPADQDAQPQAYNGCNPRVMPLNINFDILYVQSLGTTVRDLAFNLIGNIYTGTDISLLSSHLFEAFEIVQWAWCEEPYKIVWAIRSDGRLLSLTFLKEQEVQGWARHDTNGIFVSVCSVSEPPVNAPYFIVKRFVSGQWWYFSERMDNRNWQNVEDTYCVDAGLTLPQPTPDANIQASASQLAGQIGSVTVVLGGANYTDPLVRVEDPSGSGAELTATVVGGVITSINVVSPGTGYTAPEIVIQDSIGSGALAHGIISNPITVSADAPVFSSDDVGKIIRLGGGIGEVTSFISNVIVGVDLRLPITDIILNDPDKTPMPIASGDWSLTTPVNNLRNLQHLEGKAVSVLADGGVIQGLTVEDGQITLPFAASQILVGLGFQAQLQSLYTDLPGETKTIQGKRKNIQQVIVRTKLSRGMSIGTNQVDASTQQNQATIPWTQMFQIKDRSAQINAGNAIPLYTGDIPVNTAGNFSKPGQVACQQDFPLPMNILALIPDVVVGDDDG